MSNYNPTINHLALGELSRRKLHMVSMLSSDTLRRAVLIHNIVRSTASLPPSPTILTHQSESQSDYDYYPPSPAHVSEGPEVETHSEMNFREAAATTTDAGSDSDMFMFPPPMTPSAQEEQWLDSVLDDLEEDGVYVSVVAAEEHENSEGEVDPLLATAAATSCSPAPPPSLPPVSPPLRPALPYRTSPYSEPPSPPRSPPGLDEHSFSDDDEDEDYMDDSDGDDEVVTPTSSTELRSSESYFFGPLPFHCNFQPIN